MNHYKKSLFRGLFFLGLIALVGTPTFYLGYFALTSANPESQTPIIFQVHKGQNPNEITKLLESTQAISSGKQMMWVGRILRQWKKIKAGEYQISSNMSPIEIFSVLTSGISIVHPVTVREGENIFEIADDLAAKGLASKEGFLQLANNTQFIHSLGNFKNEHPLTLEGYLFPDTYFLNRTMTTEEIIKQMVNHFFDFWGKGEETRAIALKMSRHQVITLASMIEKETGASEERPLISSVFHNRLKQRMRLQSDPTTIYGMWSRYQGKITRADLLEKTPYNTYTIESLPIGPISNPGKASIQAALFPTESPYLFFVSHNDGTHQFSKNLQDHNRAVAKFQIDPKARIGKSWRDYNKKSASNFSEK